MLSEKAGKGQPEKRNGPQSKQAYVLTLWALQPFALLRLCAQQCDYFSRPAQHSASGRTIIYSLHSHGYFYLESTYHLAHESINTRAVRPFSPTGNFRASPMQPGHQVSLTTQIPHSQRHPPPTRESITPQPLNPPSIDNTTQMHDPRRLSLLQFNIQPTHSHPS